jgi:hypothetical protein
MRNFNMKTENLKYVLLLDYFEPYLKLHSYKKKKALGNNTYELVLQPCNWEQLELLFQVPCLSR